ncbi:MAG: hypothetical protein ACLQUY_03550 [Ktedonobacterales bacterium]
MRPPQRLERETVESPPAAGIEPRAARAIAFVLLLLLAAQFLLGMVDNLFVQIPLQHPGSAAGNYFAGA